MGRVLIACKMILACMQCQSVDFLEGWNAGTIRLFDEVSAGLTGRVTDSTVWIE
jgi:Zn ribbon nucleic-acid-binding protein